MRHKSEQTMTQVTDAVNGFYTERGRTPSITEIAAAVGRSRSTVHGYLTEMCRLGMISYKAGVIETPFTKKVSGEAVLAPVVGSVVCGKPQLEEENFEEYVALPTAIFGAGPFFLLRASGTSMIGAGIEPGDIVVVKRQSEAENGDIIVALVDNETTLKRFFRDDGNRCVRLHPENPEMEDIIVRDCFIQGVVKHIIKSA